MMRKILVLLMMPLVFITSAQSAILIEPKLGLSFLSLDQDRSGGSAEVDSSAQSIAYGAKLGYSFLGLNAGLDYMKASHELDSDLTGFSAASGNNGSFVDDTNKTDIGLFVGFDFPILLRVWGTYYFSSKIEGEGNTSGGVLNSTDTYKGSGLGLGVGFTPLPLLSVNIEFKTFSYDEWEDSDADPSSGTFGSGSRAGQSDVDGTEIFLSVSAPLNFF